MIARDLFTTTLAGEKPEQPFAWEMGICYEAIERWWNEGLPRDVDALSFFGIEQVASCGAPTNFVPDLREWRVAEEEDSELYENEAGGIVRRFKTPRGNVTQVYSSYPHRYTLRDRKSWIILKSRLDPGSPERQSAFIPFLDGHRTEKRSPGRWLGSTYAGSLDPKDGLPVLFTMLMPTYWLICSAGFENAVTLLYDEPNLVHEIFDHFSWFLVSLVKPVLARRTPDVAVLNEEAAFKQAPIMSPRMYRDMVLPYVRRVARMCRDSGVRFVFCESGGDVSSLVPLWMDVGVNGIMPVDVSGGSDPAAIRSRYPDLCMIGGVDRTALQADVSTARRAGERASRELLDAGRTIPCADGHFVITEQVSFDSMRAYRDGIRG